LSHIGKKKLVDLPKEALEKLNRSKSMNNFEASENKKEPGNAISKLLRDSVIFKKNINPCTIESISSP